MTHLIGCHAVYTAQGRVSSALYISAHDANSLWSSLNQYKCRCLRNCLNAYSSFSSNTGHVVFIASSIHLVSLNSRPKLDGRSIVGLGNVIIVELVVFQVVCPYIQASRSC